ncbi:MAG: hypothetical protein Q8Q85_07580 [Gemmatimonadales bacterium]|nr:hypothetical protein [Gemmatimonadales bacterium]
MLARAQAGALRSLLNPVTGMAEVGVEAWGGVRRGRPEGGVRGMLQVPYLSTGIGAEYNLRTGSVDMLVTSHTPVRRGGLLTRGTRLRMDWYPLSSHSFLLGVSAPLRDPLAGRGRPVRSHVVVSGALRMPADHRSDDPELAAALEGIRISAEWIGRTVAPFLDQDGRRAAVAVARTRRYLAEMRGHLAARSAEQEVRHFHAEVERAFALASGDPATGRELARLSREVVLAEVLLPYDALLGRQRRRDNLSDLSLAARGRFGRLVTTPGLVAENRTEAVLFVFQRLTEILEEIRGRASREWDDPRLVWLPLQYALLPEEHDEQAELDALIERATGVRFTDRNRLSYVANLGFHEELLRMIRQTRDYHVLWIHDFPAITDGGLDTAAFAQVVDGYLAALADRVEAYDSTGTLPSFFVFLDQHYYEQRRSHILMSILEDPLRASPSLGQAQPRQVAHLDSALHRLRRAVDRSRVLQAEAREYGEGWLHNRIKVHVNITNRPDASFWGGGLISSVFGYPDDIMRDHRKIAFRDVTEDDPYRGEAILTGMGVGQQYLGPGWDDRSLILEGPLLLELRRQARELLLSQGMPERAIPIPLRPKAFTAMAVRSAAESADAVRFDTRAMALMNGTGYLPKPLNVAKAVLYSLMPPGTVFKIPDSLWNSTFFGSLLVGAALRGGHALVVSPARDNAPSAGFPQLERAHELFTRLLLVRGELGDAINAAGGDLRVGLYALPPDTNGFASRADRWANGVGSTAFLQALLPFAPALVPVVAAAGRQVAALSPNDTAAPVTPKLHHKVQFVATRAFLTAITRSPEWPRFMSMYLQHRQATYATRADYANDRGLPDSLGRIADLIFAEAREVPGAASFAMVGSQNQDYRGMFMDGEVGVLFTGAESLVPLIDLVFMMGTVRWVDDQQTLDRLLPPVGELRRRIARVAKDGL